MTNIVESTEVYQNLLTDFGFKFVFGKEKYLVPFLNELLQGKEKIKKIKRLNSEHFGKNKDERRAIFDIYCENEKGELILLEMQNFSQDYFLDRSIYYSSFLIQQQGKKGKWNFRLKKMYVIGILNFVPKQMKENTDCICRVKLCDIKTNVVISEDLNFIFVNLERFNKTSDELKTLMDYWLYVLIHSQSKYEMDESVLRKNKLFAELLETIKLDKLNETEMKAYKTSKSDYEGLKVYMTGYLRDERRDGMRKGMLQGVRKGIAQGIQQGVQQGIKKTAFNALMQGHSVEEVSAFTGLSLAEIEELQKQSK
jgi:predicted transposase/invertase (TIGR01784 family)